MWISGFTFIFLTLLLPETLEDNILLKRARRLRKLTGNSELRSQSEIDQASLSRGEVIYENLVRPFILAAEPAVFFANLYLGLVCTSFRLPLAGRVVFWWSWSFVDSVFYLWVSQTWMMFQPSFLIAHLLLDSLRLSHWYSTRYIICRLELEVFLS